MEHTCRGTVGLGIGMGPQVGQCLACDAEHSRYQIAQLARELLVAWGWPDCNLFAGSAEVVEAVCDGPRVPRKRPGRPRRRELSPFGHRLRSLIEASPAFQTRAEFIKALGLTGATLYRYEVGEREPRRDLLERMASLLGVSVASLHPGHGDSAKGWETVVEAVWTIAAEHVRRERGE